MINTNDFLLCSVRDKKTNMFGNVFMARNTVELERDMFRVVHSPNSPYKDFENEYEICLLGYFNLIDGIELNDNNSYEVYKSLEEVKNLNMNDKEAING